MNLEELLSTLQATLEEVRLELQRVRNQAKGNDPLSIKEATDYLGIGRTTLNQYIKRGEITPSEYGSRVWIIRSELDAFIARHRRPKLRGHYPQ